MVKESGLNIENKVKINVENSLQLIGYDLKRNRQDSFLETTFYYRCLNPTEQDINIFLDVVDENQALLMRKDFPVCYRIFPTQSWQKGQVFKDHLRLYLPPRLLEKRYQLKIGFFDYRSGIICKVQDQDALGRVRLSE